MSRKPFLNHYCCLRPKEHQIVSLSNFLWVVVFFLFDLPSSSFPSSLCSPALLPPLRLLASVPEKGHLLAGTILKGRFDVCVPVPSGTSQCHKPDSLKRWALKSALNYFPSLLSGYDPAARPDVCRNVRVKAALGGVKSLKSTVCSGALPLSVCFTLCVHIHHMLCVWACTGYFLN